jgi:aminopeptidase N
VNLLADQWEMARAGQAEMDTFLNALQSMAADPSRLVVNAVCDYVTALNGQVDKADRESFAQFANGIMEPHMQRYLGPQTLSGDELETKARVLGLMAGVCKNQTAIAHLKDVAAQERTDSGSVDPAMASVAVSTVAAQGDQTTLNELVAAYQQRLAGNASPSTLARYLSAMTGFEKPEVLARVTGMAAGLPQQGDTFSFPQDQMVRSFGQLLANREGQEATWTFMQQNWEAIRSKAGTLSLSNLVESLSALPVEKAAEVKEFFEKNPVPEAARSVDKALETMALKGELLTRVRPQVTAWLAHWKASQA